MRSEMRGDAAYCAGFSGVEATTRIHPHPSASRPCRPQALRVAGNTGRGYPKRVVYPMDEVLDFESQALRASLGVPHRRLQKLIRLDRDEVVVWARRWSHCRPDLRKTMHLH